MEDKNIEQVEELEVISTVDATDEELQQKEKELEELEKKHKKRKKKKIGRIITNILLWILFLIIILEAGVGIINMQRINNDQKPIWYLSTNTTKTEGKEVVTYNLGLYKIVKTDTAKETKTSLKPFFIGD